MTANIMETVGKDLYSQYRAGYENNPFIFSAVNIRSNSVASVPFLVFDKSDNEITKPDHDLIKLLNNPNPEMSGKEFVREIQEYLGINGNAMIYMVRTTFHGIVEMWPISPDKAIPVRTNNLFEPVSSWTINLGDRTIVANPEDVIHIKLNKSSDGFYGVSPMFVAKRAADMQNAASKWNTSALNNGARPSITLKVHNTLSKRQRKELKEEIRGGYQGPENTGNAMVIGDDMDVIPTGFTAVEMDFANGMVMNSREIAVAYGVPSELIGDVANKTYANAAEAGRQFAVNCVKPLLEQFWETLNKVLTPLYKDVGKITFDIAQVQDLSGDQTPLYNAITAADFLTTNEKRQVFGFDDVGPDGDVILTNMSRVPLTEAVTEITVPPMNDTGDGSDGEDPDV